MEQTALAWFARWERGLAPGEAAELDQWLAADPEHARIFNELSGTWEMLRAAKPVPARSEWRQPTRFRVLRAICGGVGIAAALAAGYFGWWRPTYYSGDTVTEIGALHTLHLPDGSVVTLNTDSAFAVAFSPTDRRVRLERGEAHFTVAKDLSRPFVVHVAGASVRAVGTAFNVRLELEEVAVLVTEGRVRVEDSRSGRNLLEQSADHAGASTAAAAAPPGELLVSSGQAAIVARPDLAKENTGPVRSLVAPVAPAEMQRQLAWKERRLDFADTPLVDIVREFNRYNRHKLVIGDSTLATRRFGGAFRPDDRDGFVRMLEENFGVSAEDIGEQTVLRISR